MRKLGDFGMLEILAAGEDAAEQDGGVDRGDFRVPQPLAGIDIRPVVEESAMIREFLPEKPHRIEDAIARLRVRNEAALVGDANRGEAEAERRDAAELIILIRRDHIAAVAHEAGIWIRLLPEKKEIRALDLIAEGLGPAAKRSAGREAE